MQKGNSSKVNFQAFGHIFQTRVVANKVQRCMYSCIMSTEAGHNGGPGGKPSSTGIQVTASTRLAPPSVPLGQGALAKCGRALLARRLPLPRAAGLRRCCRRRRLRAAAVAPPKPVVLAVRGRRVRIRFLLRCKQRLLP